MTDTSDSTSPICKSRRMIQHDHHYEHSPSTLCRRLAKCQKVIEEQKKIIKLQKRKEKRLRNKVLSIKEIILEIRQNNRVSNNCLNSLESISDKGVTEFLKLLLQMVSQLPFQGVNTQLLSAVSL